MLRWRLNGVGDCNGEPLMQVADYLPFRDEYDLSVAEFLILCSGSTESWLEVLGYLGEMIDPVLMGKALTILERQLLQILQ